MRCTRPRPRPRAAAAPGGLCVLAESFRARRSARPPPGTSRRLARERAAAASCIADELQTATAAGRTSRLAAQASARHRLGSHRTAFRRAVSDAAIARRSTTAWSFFSTLAEHVSCAAGWRVDVGRRGFRRHATTVGEQLAEGCARCRRARDRGDVRARACSLGRLSHLTAARWIPHPPKLVRRTRLRKRESARSATAVSQRLKFGAGVHRRSTRSCGGKLVDLSDPYERFEIADYPAFRGVTGRVRHVAPPPPSG